MYVAYGSFRHGADEAGWTLEERPIRSPRGGPYLINRVGTVIGRLLNKTGIEKEMATKIDRLISAYSVDGRDFGLYHSDGSKTPLFMDSSRSVTGTRVTTRGFPVPDSVYATNYPFRVQVEADFEDPNAGQVLQYRESLTFLGNGRRRIVGIEVERGLPEIQVTRERTLCRAFQSGSAVGLHGYPVPNPPYWLDALENPDEAVTLVSPEKNGAGFVFYEINWNYRFLSAIPFARRLPTLR